MNRKYVYGLLATPIALVLIALLVAPAEMRSTFFSEFKYRTKEMMGYEQETYGHDELGPSEQDLEAMELELQTEAGNQEASEGEFSESNSEDADSASETSPSNDAEGKASADDGDEQPPTDS